MNGLGKSGDKVELFTKTVVKTSDKSRLLVQAYKQTLFVHPTIKVPNIRKISRGTSYQIEMDRIYAQSLIEAFTYLSVEQVKDCIEQILQYIDHNLDVPAVTVSREILEQKAGDYVDLFRQFTPPTIEIPIGQCHGDLTLGNILYNKNLFFIDFLDSFVETPLADIAKLRQDTFHGWNSFLLKENNPRTKLILDYFDQQITSRYKHLPFIPFQFLTLVRILPYANEQETEFIKEELERYENINSPYVR